MSGKHVGTEKPLPPAFVLVEREQKPMKLRGKKVVPAIISALDPESLVSGEYIGISSGDIITLVHTGGFITAAPEFKEAFFLSKAVPATLGEEAASVKENEIFLPVPTDGRAEIYHFREAVFSDWKETFRFFWIPCEFHVDGKRLGWGWFRCSSKEAVILKGTLAGHTAGVRVRSLRSLSGWKIEGLLQTLVLKKEWNGLR